MGLHSACKLSLVGASQGYSSLWFIGSSLWWSLVKAQAVTFRLQQLQHTVSGVVVHGLPHCGGLSYEAQAVSIQASTVTARSRELWFVSFRVWAQWLWLTGLVLWDMWTLYRAGLNLYPLRAWAGFFIRCTTREVHFQLFLRSSSSTTQPIQWLSPFHKSQQKPHSVSGIMLSTGDRGKTKFRPAHRWITQN